MVVLAALLLGLDLSIAQEFGNLAEDANSRGTSTDQSKWGFDLDRSVCKDLSISFGEFSPVMYAGISYGEQTLTHKNEDNRRRMGKWSKNTTRFSIRVPLDLYTNTYSTSIENGALVTITYIPAGGKIFRFHTVMLL